MAFPQTFLDLVPELYLGGWQNIQSRVRYEDGYDVTRGYSSESSTFVDPARCGLTIDNRTGMFSPGNPMGPYYGLIGLNTPFRLTDRTITDSFTGRTVSNGWGTAPTGDAWSLEGTARNFAVSGGTGTITIPVANTYQVAYLGSRSFTDVDIAATWSYGTTNVTGGSITPGTLIARRSSASAYYALMVEVTTAEVIQVTLLNFLSIIAGPVVIPGITHSASQQVRGRLQIEGQTLRGKVWLASASEPYDWAISAHDTTWTTGAVGVRPGVATGNTNIPVTVTFDDVEVRVPIMVGEISEWPSRWDKSESDINVSVEASGLLRRLQQGDIPLQSALRRTLPGLPGLLAYWPCEDGSASTSIASGLTTGQPMSLQPSASGDFPSFASNTAFDASASLPTTNTCRWTGPVTPYSPTTQTQLRFLMQVPDNGDQDATVISSLWTSGTAVLWEVIYLTTGNGAMKLRAWESPLIGARTMIYDSGTLSPFPGQGVNGKPLLVSLELTQNGANVDYNFEFLEAGSLTGWNFTGTVTSHTVGMVYQVMINQTQDIRATAAGHVTLQSTITSLFSFATQLNAYTGELAGARAQRLCSEEGVPFTYVGDLTTTVPMGPQRPEPFLTLLRECADAGMDTWYEPRAHTGLTYRVHTADANQVPAVVLDYSQHHIADLQPVDDDQLVRNDVTATRTNGSSYRVIQSTGPLALLDPQSGGVGRYDTSSTVNVQFDVQLMDVAGWLLRLGTLGTLRYPSVDVIQANRAIITAGLRDALCGMDIGSRVVITNPLAGQPPGPVSLLVRGFKMKLNKRQWDQELVTVPEDPFEIWELEHTTMGLLDSNSSTLAATMTTTATSVTVASTELWTTTDVPFDIKVTGERMTVTAVSGASSPQTFTVTRSVNGVVKTHASGESVVLYYQTGLSY